MLNKTDVDARRSQVKVTEAYIGPRQTSLMGLFCENSLTAFTPQNFESMFGHFTTFCMKGLSR